MLVAITGASGVQIAVKFLQSLKEKGIDFELIISKNAETVIDLETNYDLSEIYKLARKNYDVNDLTAAPASGSCLIEKMVIVPCSMKTLAAIACGYSDNLITRAADVMIKEGRKLILVVRESPLSAIHLENMLKLARLGVVIAPPIPSYYIKPKSIKDIIKNTVGRIFDLLGIETTDIKRWGMTE